jgi:lycopene cyclase domain-containing protein
MFGHTTYLVLFFAWVAPVLAIQWHAGRRILPRRWRAVAVATLLPTFYLAAADRYALGAGIWQLSPDHTTGIALFGLPLEELLFFLVTNLVVAQSVVLFLAPELTPAYARSVWRRHMRALGATLGLPQSEPQVVWNAKASKGAKSSKSVVLIERS